MSGLPAAQTPTPPPVPRSVLLADAKVTIRAPIPRVFEALLDPEQLVQWWADEPRVEAELGGRYEGTLSDGRIEGSITAIDGPGKFSFMWPILQEGGSVETSVAYELAPRVPRHSCMSSIAPPSPSRGAGRTSGMRHWNPFGRSSSRAPPSPSRLAHLPRERRSPRKIYLY